MKYIENVVTLVLLILILTGCSSLMETTEEVPILEKAVADISVLVNDSIPLTMEYVEAYDANGDNMTLLVHAGDNYTVIGNVVIPVPNFIGDLYVPIQVKDETGRLSRIGTLTVSVLPELLEIQPLFLNAEWHYNDTFHTIDSFTTSRLHVTQQYTGSVTGVDEDIFIMQWSNADSLGLKFLQSNSSEGLHEIGTIAPNDTLVAQELKLKSPAVEGDTWAYSQYLYNVDIKGFVKAKGVDSMSCTSPLVYVEVPAGIFPCTEYEYSFPYTPQTTRSAGQSTPLPEGIILPPMSVTRADAEHIITVKLYYSTGVGYVQNMTYLDGQLVTRKVLTDYIVEEK